MPLQSTSGAATYDAFGVSAVSAVTQAEAIDFDGTNDFLSRSSDLSGNTDRKTFTFSAWVWRNFTTGTSYIYTTDNTTDARVQVYISDTAVGLFMKNSSGTVILNASRTINLVDTFINILWSVDLTSTSNRSLYINDVLQNVTWTTYTNENIDFTQPNHNVGGGPTLGSYIKARLSNVYLDSTYRNLSVEANRRLFVTADLKPAAGQAALNPILYLPMSDPTAPGVNTGTGGNFTLTGVVARSGRGPNQYNAPYSNVDGVNDYLTHGTMSVAATKVFTLSVCINSSLAANVAGSIFYTRDSSTSTGIELRYFTYAGGDTGFFLEMQNAAGSNIFTGYVPKITTTASGRNYTLTLCINMDSQSACRAYINGVSQSLTISNFTTGQTIRATNRASIAVTADFIGNFYNPFKGSIGAFWFNPTYVDLSVAANLAKFVSGTGINAVPVDPGATGELPTGTSPLVYLPMYGNNAGRNYGTGGNFTVNSGPYTGARGPNEFWGNKMDLNGNSPRAYLSRTSALAGVSDGNVISGSFWCSFDSAGSAEDIFRIASSSNGDRFRISKNSSDQINIRARNTAGTILLNVTASGTFGAGDYYVQFCFDLANGSNKHLYINGVQQGFTITTYTNGSMGLSEPNVWVGTYDSTQLTMNGRLAEFYLSASYIDFSQEANRLKFRDAFGNPTDLPSAITAATVPTPAIYLRFNPASFGTNSGTGGDFTVTSTPTDGGQL